MKKLFWLLLLLPIVSWTQTAYHMPRGKVFVCDAASRQPVASFYQFDCRGIPLEDKSGTIVGSFYLFSVNELVLGLPGFIGNPYQSHTVNPQPLTSPGYTFSFFTEDFNGKKLNGVAYLEWKNFHLCGGRGCQWWAPELTKFEVTVVDVK